MIKNAITATTAATVGTPSRLYNSAAAEPFANGTTASYVEDMYNSWLRDPSSVHTVITIHLSHKSIIYQLKLIRFLVMGCLFS